MERLSGKQREVVFLLGEGISNKEIARRMGITEGTVKLHMMAIFDKLGVRKRTQVALLATKS